MNVLPVAFSWMGLEWHTFSLCLQFKKKAFCFQLKWPKNVWKKQQDELCSFLSLNQLLAGIFIYSVACFKRKRLKSNQFDDKGKNSLSIFSTKSHYHFSETLKWLLKNKIYQKYIKQWKYIVKVNIRFNHPYVVLNAICWRFLKWQEHEYI